MAGTKSLTSYLFEIDPGSSTRILVPKKNLNIFKDYVSLMTHSEVDYIDWLQTLAKFGVRVNKQERYSPYNSSTRAYSLVLQGKEVNINENSLVHVIIDEYWLPVSTIASIRGGFIQLETNFPENPTFICDEKSFEEYYNKARSKIRADILSKFTKIGLPRFIMCKY